MIIIKCSSCNRILALYTRMPKKIPTPKMSRCPECGHRLGSSGWTMIIKWRL